MNTWHNKLSVVETVTDHNGITYNRLNSGTCYHVGTPEEVYTALEHARMTHTRIKVHFGDTGTGRDWNEENMVIGYVGRSTGTIKIPILVYNRRAYGGPALLDHCIVKIVTANGGHVLYQHPHYQPPEITIGPSDTPGYTHSLYVNGELYSNHHSEKDAERLKAHLLK